MEKYSSFSTLPIFLFSSVILILTFCNVLALVKKQPKVMHNYGHFSMSYVKLKDVPLNFILIFIQTKPRSIKKTNIIFFWRSTKLGSYFLASYILIFCFWNWNSKKNHLMIKWWYCIIYKYTLFYYIRSEWIKNKNQLENVITSNSYPGYNEMNSSLFKVFKFFFTFGMSGYIVTTLALMS